ncbi:MAG: hypothetical protein K1X79_02480 [Oligoflexia bacterium]|nr:hypothetical protein [Oligoflexia bacterium]
MKLKVPSPTLLLAFSYFGISLAFACIRLIIVSQARDPFLWGIRIPGSFSLQLGLGLTSAAAALVSLGGLVAAVNRGRTAHLVAAFFLLPLVLILLEVVTLDI